MEVEVGTLLLSNDKNNVIAQNVLLFFMFKLQVGCTGCTFLD